MLEEQIKNWEDRYGLVCREHNERLIIFTMRDTANFDKFTDDVEEYLSVHDYNNYIHTFDKVFTEGVMGKLIITFPAIVWKLNEGLNNGIKL